jgi:hypothetical protein
MALAEQCKARIRAAGRVPPDDAVLVSDLLPHAKEILRAARTLMAAGEWYRSAHAAAEAAAGNGGAAVDAIVAAWISRPAEPGTVAAEFDAIVAGLGDVGMDVTDGGDAL